MFCSVLYLNTFTFGGGFVIISLMKKKFVDEKRWIEEDEMLDLAAIAQSSPGSIAINSSILVGYKVGGAAGTIVAVLATVLPPLIILTAISFFYEAFRDNRWIAGMLKGMQACVAAIVLEVACSMGMNFVAEKQIRSCVVMAAAFAAVFFLEVNVIYVIVICIVLGIAHSAVPLLRQRSKQKKGGERREP